MTQPIAIVDIDDVLCDTTPFMLATLNRQLGTAYDVAQMQVFNLWENFPIDREHVLALIHDDDFQHAFPPIEEAIRGLRRLREGGYLTWLVTGRPETVRASTLAWLDRCGVHYDRLLMGVAGSEKATVLPGRVALAFDDRADAALAYAPLADQVYLLAKPWNRSVDGHLPGNVRRIAAWDEVTLQN